MIFSRSRRFLVVLIALVIASAWGVSSATAGGGFPTTTQNCVLDVGVVIQNDHQYYNLCSVTLGPGNWVITGNISVLSRSTSQKDDFYGLVWATGQSTGQGPSVKGGGYFTDGIASAWQTIPPGTYQTSMSMTGFVTISVNTQTTFSLSAYSFTTDPTIVVIGRGGAGRTAATQLVAFRTL